MGQCELWLVIVLQSFGLAALDLDDGEGSFEASFSGLEHLILDRSSVIFCLTLIKMGLRGESSELLEVRGLQYISWVRGLSTFDIFNFDT